MPTTTESAGEAGVASTREAGWKQVSLRAVAALDSPRLARLRPLVGSLRCEPAIFSIEAKRVRTAVSSQQVPAPMKVFALRSFVPVDSEASQLSGSGIPEIAVASNPLDLPPTFPAILLPAVVNGLDPSGSTRCSSGAVVEVYTSLLSGPVEVSGRESAPSVLVHITPLGVVCAFFDPVEDTIVVATIE